MSFSPILSTVFDTFEAKKLFPTLDLTFQPFVLCIIPPRSRRSCVTKNRNSIQNLVWLFEQTADTEKHTFAFQSGQIDMRKDDPFGRGRADRKKEKQTDTSSTERRLRRRRVVFRVCQLCLCVQIIAHIIAMIRRRVRSRNELRANTNQK